VRLRWWVEPARFLRGNLFYDEALVGFEWEKRPAARYGPNDTILVKEYDTAVPSIVAEMPAFT